LSVAKWRVDALNAAFRAVAATRPKRLTVVDIQHASDALHPTRWDTVHYTASGADVLGGAVDPALARLLPSSDPTATGSARMRMQY
jgi:hypothetical protein